jgi:polygalacturonase
MMRILKSQFFSAVGFILTAAFCPIQTFAQTITITSAPYNASTASADNAAAIQAAIKAVGSERDRGGPWRAIFSAAPSHFKSNMTLQLSAGATLQMTAMGTFPTNTRLCSTVQQPDQRHHQRQRRSWTVRAPPGGPPLTPAVRFARPPAMIEMTNCTGVTVTGITVQNSPMFHIQLLGNGSNILRLGA